MVTLQDMQVFNMTKARTHYKSIAASGAGRCSNHRQYYMLLNTCQELADEKVHGKNYQEVHDDIIGYKVGLHVIFYRTLKGNKIEIARILHRRMDLKSRMQE